MIIKPYTENAELYLQPSDVIDYKDEAIAELSERISNSSVSEIDYIKKVYEFVRDNIAHSADANRNEITCSASEVLRAGHGICFAKSHLLAALLRYKGIPTGFCYQRLILDDDTAPVLILHGLNGVYLSEYGKWIRLDARGNKEGVNAQFSAEKEQLAFPVRPDMGEEDIDIVFPQPDKNVLEKLRACQTRTELWNDLPTKLAYGIRIEDDLIRLEQAALSHRDAAEEMKQEFFDNNENVINGSALFDQMSFDEWLENTDRNHSPETVRSDWAVATTFFAIRQFDDKILGMIDVRHELTVPFLQEYGGHIGYAVRPSERRKGYATRMLKLALSYCCSIGIPAVRLGCYTDNKASIRTIERCGGVCIEEKPYLDGKPMAVFQIST